MHACVHMHTEMLEALEVLAAVVQSFLYEYPCLSNLVVSNLEL